MRKKEQNTMAFVELDLTKEGFEPIPAGNYRVRIEDSESEKVSKGKNMGKSLIKWTFVVLSPEKKVDPLTSEEVETAGKKLFRRTPAWAGAGGFLADLVKTAGANISALGFDTKDIHGVELFVDVSLGDYEGRPTNNIEAWMPVPQKKANGTKK
jgi:hypothetical protein